MTGRLGYTWGPALLYAKGGYAWRDGNNIGVTFAGVPQAFTTSGNRKDGYTVGAGLEYMFAPNWSAKAEYQYYNFGNTTLTAGPADIVGTRFRNDEHTVKAGINYRFGWGGPADIADPAKDQGRREPAFFTTLGDDRKAGTGFRHVHTEASAG